MQLLSNINIADFQGAIDRAEINGPLKTMDALHKTLAADAIWNKKGIGFQQVRNRLIWGFNQDLITSQTHNTKKNKRVSRVKNDNGNAISQLREMISYLSKNKNVSVKISIKVSSR